MMYVIDICYSMLKRGCWYLSCLVELGSQQHRTTLGGYLKMNFIALGGCILTSTIKFIFKSNDFVHTP
ncbi:hypothetical protein Lalb_Chr25g0281081 [Lupinus albus]|uniref:Uncharacterized protein n=1 Tax=Lupinus albus TaxID=3870 RepID=A0A6A4MXS5_LUPAL|nr:hypothetical protein Lalb_Chr25g0281081 [Lupinus albus]